MKNFGVNIMPTLISNKHRLVFIHIPKTGGQTVYKSLLRYQSNMLNGLWLAISRRRQRTFLTKKLPNIEPFTIWGTTFTNGHDTASQLVDNIPHIKDYKYFTLVRDPLMLELSRYNFILSRPKHEQHLKVSKLDFDSYLNYRMDSKTTISQYKYINYPDLDVCVFKQENMSELTVFLKSFDIDFDHTERYNQSQKYGNLQDLRESTAKKFILHQAEDYKKFNYEYLLDVV